MAQVAPLRIVATRHLYAVPGREVNELIDSLGYRYIALRNVTRERAALQTRKRFEDSADRNHYDGRPVRGSGSPIWGSQSRA